jgi:NAD(P)-dependent dehydrogenase (short-subunit alcohol dehydrogenase family)
VLENISSRFDFHGKVAVVTGGGSGIGRATCEQLVAQGSAVVVADLNLENANATVERVGGAEFARAVEVDVRHPAGGVAAAAAAMTNFHRLDVLVNCAGVYPSKPVLDVDEEHWDLVIDVNQKGTFFASQACARAMIESGNPGAIVNIASLRGLQADQAVVTYSASKAAVISLTRSFAQALAPHSIRVNVVAPGAIYTEATEQASKALMNDTDLTIEEWQELFTRRVPLHRFGQPYEVADAIVFLASDASSYMTGSVLSIDGGGY